MSAKTPPAAVSGGSFKSLSEDRAEKAAIWVENEVMKLLGQIEETGTKHGGEVHVTFGELFYKYQDVSECVPPSLPRSIVAVRERGN